MGNNFKICCPSIFRVDYPELMKHSEFDIDSDGTVSTEEAKVKYIIEVLELCFI